MCQSDQDVVAGYLLAGVSGGISYANLRPGGDFLWVETAGSVTDREAVSTFLGSPAGQIRTLCRKLRLSDATIPVSNERTRVELGDTGGVNQADA